jgi:hypothetical protein
MQSIKALRPAPTRTVDAAIPRRPPIWARATTGSVSQLPSTSSAAKANLLGVGLVMERIWLFS